MKARVSGADQSSRADGPNQAPESKESENHERDAERQTQRSVYFGGRSERKNQRIRRTAGFEAGQQHQIRSHKRAAQPAPFARSDFRAAAPREHH